MDCLGLAWLGFTNVLKWGKIRFVFLFYSYYWQSIEFVYLSLLLLFDIVVAIVVAFNVAVAGTGAVLLLLLLFLLFCSGWCFVKHLFYMFIVVKVSCCCSHWFPFFCFCFFHCLTKCSSPYSHGADAVQVLFFFLWSGITHEIVDDETTNISQPYFDRRFVFSLVHFVFCLFVIAFVAVIVLWCFKRATLKWMGVVVVFLIDTLRRLNYTKVLRQNFYLIPQQYLNDKEVWTAYV